MFLLPIFYIASILFTWMVIGSQQITDLPGFLSSSWLVAQAYTEAMFLGFSQFKGHQCFWYYSRLCCYIHITIFSIQERCITNTNPPFTLCTVFHLLQEQLC
jgi:hypothetical protein